MSILPKMTHASSLTVRSYECDSYGHVNNAVFLNYLEYARIEFLRHVGFEYEKARSAGYGLFVKEIKITYLSQACPAETLRIETTPVKRGAASGTFRQIIYKKSGEKVADAYVTWAFVDSIGKPTRIPPKFDNPALDPDRLLTPTGK